VVAGLLAVVVLRIAVVALVGVARLLLVVAAVVVLWFVVTRGIAKARRR